MEGMRGFAALLVFLVHFRALFGHYAEGTALVAPVLVLGTFGHTGVDLFFLLSGYLVYGIVISPRFRFWSFFVRRIQRLYPTFLLVLGLYLIIELLLPSRSKLPSLAGNAVLYILSNVLVLPGVFPIQPIIAVAWSLSYEWCFYLVLPLLVGVLAIRRWPWIWRAAFFFALSCVCFSATYFRFLPNSRFALFGAGILLWEWLHNESFVRFLPRQGEFVAVALFAMNLLIIGGFSRLQGTSALMIERTPAFYVVSLFFTGSLLTLYAISFDGYLAKAFSWDPLRWVGNMSYSYYLIHGITLVAIQAIGFRLIHSAQLSAPALALLFLACLVATLVVSTALYLGFEWPLSLAKAQRRTLAKKALRSDDLASTPTS